MDGVRYAVEVLGDNGCQDALDWDLLIRREFDDAAAAVEEYNKTAEIRSTELIKMLVVDIECDGEWLPVDIAAACLLTPPRFRPRALIRAALSDGPVGLHDLIQIAEKEGVGRSPVVNFVYNNALGRIVRVERGVYGLPEGADPWWYDLNDEYISGEGLEEHARATLSSAA